MVRSEDHSQPLAFRVGLGQDIAKVLGQRLLAPALTLSRPVRLLVRQEPIDALAEALSKHELDLVLSDAPLGATAWGRLESKALAEGSVTFYAANAQGRAAPEACSGPLASSITHGGSSPSAQPSSSGFMTRVFTLSSLVSSTTVRC